MSDQIQSTTSNGEFSAMNHWVLITGGAHRIGAEIATIFAKNGANVIIHYKNSETKAKDLCVLLEKAFSIKALAVCADLEKQQGLEKLVKFCVAETNSSISILVNNASIFTKDTFNSASISSLQQMINIHVFAPFFLSQQFPSMSQNSSVPKFFRSIINLLDAYVGPSMTHHFSYSLSKESLKMLTKQLSISFAPKSIRVNAVAPGLALEPIYVEDGLGDSAFASTSTPQLPSVLESLRHTNPLGVVTGSYPIAESALFLAKSQYITGQIIHVDGGKHIK